MAEVSILFLKCDFVFTEFITLVLCFIFQAHEEEHVNTQVALTSQECLASTASQPSQASTSSGQNGHHCPYPTIYPSSDEEDTVHSTLEWDDFGSTVLERPTPAQSPAPPIPTNTVPRHAGPAPSSRTPATCPTPTARVARPGGAGTSTAAAPGPSNTPSAAIRSRKRKSSLDFEAILSTLDRRAAEREAKMEAARQKRTEVINQLMGLHDECGRNGLHVANFMRALPPAHLANFKVELLRLMEKTEQAVENEVAGIVVQNEL